MLTDNPEMKDRRILKHRKPREWYSDAQKMEAVKLWLLTGNLNQTAATLDIPLPTLRVWRYSQWWSDLVVDIRTEGSFQLSNKLKNAAERALEVSMERLENGDWIMNQKTGEMVRKHVPMRDAVWMATAFLDRQKQLEQRPIDEANNLKIQDRLQSLALAFAKFSGKVIDAIPKEREEGLQTGSSMGAEEGPSSIEGSGPEDSGPQGDREGDGEPSVLNAG